MSEEDKKILEDWYDGIRNATLNNPYFDMIPKCEFLKNIDKINFYNEDIWSKDEFFESIIDMRSLGDNSKSIYDEENEFVKNMEVDLIDIVGTEQHIRYYGLPWIIALPLLKRFDNNYPKGNLEKKELFNKMKNNNFSERLELVKEQNKYFILSGHNRIIISKILGLKKLKADVYIIK